jgi:hypothetical protein
MEVGLAYVAVGVAAAVLVVIAAYVLKRSELYFIIVCVCAIKF